jgi:DNA primase
VENCVAPLGTSFTPEHAKLLHRYTNQAAVVFDPDSAGINAALRAAMILVENGLYVNVVTIPEGLDPDEFVLKYGADTFRNLIAKAPDILNFQLNMILKGRGNLNPQEKTTVADEIIETIKKQSDGIIKNEWVRTASDRLDIPQDIFLKKMSSAGKYASYAAPRKEAKTKDNTPPRESELIKLLLRFPRYADSCAELTQNDFENNEMWLILNGIKAIREENPDMEQPAARLTEKLPEMKEKISKLSLEPMPEDVKPLRDIEDCLKAIKKAGAEKRLKQLQEEIKKYPSGAVPLDLMKEQMDIQKKIKS